MNLDKSLMMKAYDKFDRSMGILMSGDKGIGKSLLAQLLTDEVIARDFQEDIESDARSI